MQNENKSSVVDGEIVVTAVNLELDKFDASNIRKIRINTDVGDITWKAEKTISKFINGFPTKSIGNITIDDVPEKLKQIQDACTKHGKCKVTAKYKVLETKDAEGNDLKYRFIRSAKFLDSWHIQEDDKEPIEEVTIQ